MRNTEEQCDEEIDERATLKRAAGAASLPCDTYQCEDRFWCIQRSMCKAAQGDASEEYPDNGPTDPWETSGPGRNPTNA